MLRRSRMELANRSLSTRAALRSDRDKQSAGLDAASRSQGSRSTSLGVAAQSACAVSDGLAARLEPRIQRGQGWERHKEQRHVQPNLLILDTADHDRRDFRL